MEENANGGLDLDKVDGNGGYKWIGGRTELFEILYNEWNFDSGTYLHLGINCIRAHYIIF